MLWTLAYNWNFSFFTEPKRFHGCIQLIGNCLLLFSCIRHTSQAKWYSKKNFDLLCLSDWSSSLLELQCLSCQLFNCRENHFSHHFLFSKFYKFIFYYFDKLSTISWNVANWFDFKLIKNQLIIVRFCYLSLFKFWKFYK